MFDAGKGEKGVEWTIFTCWLRFSCLMKKGGPQAAWLPGNKMQLHRHSL